MVFCMFTRPGKVDINGFSASWLHRKAEKKNGGSLTRKNVKCGTCFIYLVFQEGLGLYMYIYICIYTYTCIMYIYIIIYI